MADARIPYDLTPHPDGGWCATFADGVVVALSVTLESDIHPEDFDWLVRQEYDDITGESDDQGRITVRKARESVSDEIDQEWACGI